MALPDDTRGPLLAHLTTSRKELNTFRKVAVMLARRAEGGYGA